MRISKWIITATATLSISTAASADDLTISTVETVENGGLLIRNGDSVTITETGSIEVTGSDRAITSSSNDLEILNFGILSSDDDDGVSLRGDHVSFTNHGHISGLVSGMIITGDYVEITNYGTIYNGNDAGGGGIDLYGDHARVINFGSITSSTTAGEGIYANSPGNHIENHGVIDVYVYGIDIGADGYVLNTGTIQAQLGNAIGGLAPDAVIVNTGGINSGGNGISLGGDNVTVTNSGRVTGGVNAIRLVGDNATLNLLPGSVLQGALLFTGTNATLTFGAGMNATLVTTGAPDNVTVAGGAAFSNAGVQYTFNTDQFHATSNHLATGLTGLQGDADRALANGAGVAVTMGAAGDAIGKWAKFGGAYSQQRATSTSAGFNTRSGNVAAGLTFDGDMGVYLAFDTAQSGLSDSFETKSETFIAGVHGTAMLGQTDFGWSVMAGISNNDHERTVLNNTVPGGVETATAQNTARFISPAISLSQDMPGNLTGNVQLRYIGYFADGYTETGNSLPLTIGDQESHMLVLTPSVTWSRAVGESILDLELGVQLQQTWGDQMTASAGLGSVAFRPGGDNFNARAFLNAGIESQLDNGWVFRSSGQLGASTNSVQDASLSIGFLRRF